jgi:hypothetical protein
MYLITYNASSIALEDMFVLLKGHPKVRQAEPN